MPFTHAMATRSSKVLTEVRKNGEFGGCDLVARRGLPSNAGRRLWLDEPQKIHTVVISTHHAEPLKAMRYKEVVGYTGPDETAPSMADMNAAILERSSRRL
jgi:S-adenosylmethionine synthetase